MDSSSSNRSWLSCSSPFVLGRFLVGRSDVGCLQCFQTALQSRGDGLRAAGDQPLHQDHQEAEVLAVLADRLVVAKPNVLRNRFVKLLLKLVLLFPANRHELGQPGQKERVTPFVDRSPLLCSDHQRDDFFTPDRTSSIELFGVKQRHDPLEAGGLALVRCGREQKQIWCGLSQSLAQTITGDLFSAAAEPVGLIADDQVPPGVDEVAEAFLVVRFQLLLRPAPPLLDRLDRIDGADHLIESAARCSRSQ